MADAATKVYVAVDANITLQVGVGLLYAGVKNLIPNVPEQLPSLLPFPISKIVSDAASAGLSLRENGYDKKIKRKTSNEKEKNN